MSLVWVNGLRRDAGGRWSMDVVDQCGNTNTSPAGGLYKVASVEQPRLRTWCARTGNRLATFGRFDTDFSDWQDSDPQEAALIALGHRCAGDLRQQVFEVRRAQKRILIPAALLMKALFNPLQYTMEWLLLPQGIEACGVPDLTNPPAMLVNNATWKHDIRNGRLTADLLYWTWCFPSARAAWDSVLEHANRARLGIDLPKARLNISGHGVSAGKALLATHLTLRHLTAIEVPFRFADPAWKQFKLDSRTMTDNIAPGPARFLSRKLTTNEWNAIAPLLLPKTGRPQSNSPRDLFDAINAKFSSGAPWRKVPLEAGTWENLAYHYRKWRKFGVWERALSILANEGAPVYLGPPLDM